MEFLQGRALTNAIGNLNIQDAYADALRKFGLELEEITEQVIQNCNLYVKYIILCSTYHQIVPIHVKYFGLYK
jgi:hypothetical protein